MRPVLLPTLLLGACLLSPALAQSRVPPAPHTASTTSNPTPPPDAPIDPNAPTYSINLSPPNVVGQKFSVVTDSTIKNHLTAKFTVLGVPTLGPSDDETDVVHLEAEGEVLAIFPDGAIQKLSLTVVTLSATIKGKPVPQLPTPGAKIIVESTPHQSPSPTLTDKTSPTPSTSAAKKPAADSSASSDSSTDVSFNLKDSETGKTYNNRIYDQIITVDGQPASADLARLLDGVLGLGRGEQSTQQQFGPAKPVAIGARWPVNSTAIFAPRTMLHSYAMSATGSIKLLDVHSPGPAQSITVSGNISFTGVTPWLPPDLPAADRAQLAPQLSDAFDCTFTDAISLTIPAARTNSVEKRTEKSTFSGQLHASKIGFGVKGTQTTEQTSTTVITYH